MATDVLKIDYLNRKGKGVAFFEGATYLCDGVLPGEQVRILKQEKSRRHVHVIDWEPVHSHPQRVPAKCPCFNDCGGCQLQNLEYSAQIQLKQEMLAHYLAGKPGIKPDQWLEPVTSKPYHYRRRARLGVFCYSSGDIAIGFRRKNHRHILDIAECDVLENNLSSIIAPLHDLIRKISCPDRIPRLELAAGDNTRAVVIRHLVPLTDQDMVLLNEFSTKYETIIFTQEHGPDSIKLVTKHSNTMLNYTVLEQEIFFEFSPVDFVQANAGINQSLVSEVINALNMQEGDNVLDLFCGLGNFSVPVACTARGIPVQVTGIDSNAVLVRRAMDTVKKYRLDNLDFRQMDLYTGAETGAIELTGYNKLVLDPPREGAIDILKLLPRHGPEKIIYVSCDMISLGRDLSYLVKYLGYNLDSIRLFDMFPQTIHFETLSVLTRKG